MFSDYCFVIDACTVLCYSMHQDIPVMFPTKLELGLLFTFSAYVSYKRKKERREQENKRN